MAKARALRLFVVLSLLTCCGRSLCWSHGTAVPTESCAPAVSFSQNIPQIDFSDEQKREFKFLVNEQLGGVNPYKLGKDLSKLEEYVAKAEAIVRQVIPKKVLAQIRDHVLSSDGLGFCLVKVPLEHR